MVEEQQPQAGAQHVYALLHEACTMLDAFGDYAIAAMVSQCLAMVETRYDLDIDPAPDPA